MTVPQDRGASADERMAVRHADVTTIFETTAFRASAVFDVVRGRPVTVVSAVRQSAEASAALDRLYRAHRDPVHPVIAPAIERIEEPGASEVVFDVPAAADFDTLLRSAASAGVKASQPEADGLVVTVRDGLLASARAEGRHDDDRFLGTVGLSNIVFALDGRFWLIGLGHNVAVHDEGRRMVARTRFYQAPEVAVGHAASERSDFVALLMMLRGTIPFVDMHGAIVRVLAGNTLGQDLELLRHILWIERRAIHADPKTRATIEQTIRVSDRIRELTGTRPDPAGFVRCAGQLLGGLTKPRVAAPPPLRVSTRGVWMERGRGPRVDLSRRTVLGRTVVVLAKARIESPGHPLDVPALSAACWPGERILPAAAANRVYVAISGLRRLGLGPDLEHVPDGYRITPAIACELVDT